MKRIVDETFAGQLADKKYDPEMSPQMAKEMSKIVLDRIRSGERREECCSVWCGSSLG